MQFAFSSLPIQRTGTMLAIIGMKYSRTGCRYTQEDDENKFATYLYIEATDDRKSSAGSSIEKSNSDPQQTHWIPVVCVLYKPIYHRTE